MNQAAENPNPTSWWQRPFDSFTLTIAALLSGVMLWNGLFPSFYYMSFVFFVMALWGALAAMLLVRLPLASLGMQLTGRPIIWTGWRGVMTLVSVVSVATLLKVPLHMGFALARAGLDRAIDEEMQAESTFPLSRSVHGIYAIQQQAQRRCHHEDRIYFTLANDSEAAFVYSPSGIDDLCYNSGDKGHLAGNWYWMAED